MDRLPTEYRKNGCILETEVVSFLARKGSDIEWNENFINEHKIQNFKGKWELDILKELLMYYGEGGSNSKQQFSAQVKGVERRQRENILIVQVAIPCGRLGIFFFFDFKTNKFEADEWEVELCNITGDPCSVESSRRRLATVSGTPSTKKNLPIRVHSAYGDVQVTKIVGASPSTLQDINEATIFKAYENLAETAPEESDLAIEQDDDDVDDAFLFDAEHRTVRQSSDKGASFSPGISEKTEGQQTLHGIQQPKLESQPEDETNVFQNGPQELNNAEYISETIVPTLPGPISNLQNKAPVRQEARVPTASEQDLSVAVHAFDTRRATENSKDTSKRNGGLFSITCRPRQVDSESESSDPESPISLPNSLHSNPDSEYDGYRLLLRERDQKIVEMDFSAAKLRQMNLQFKDLQGNLFVKGFSTFECEIYMYDVVNFGEENNNAMTGQNGQTAFYNYIRSSSDDSKVNLRVERSPFAFLCRVWVRHWSELRITLRGSEIIEMDACGRVREVCDPAWTWYGDKKSTRTLTMINDTPVPFDAETNHVERMLAEAIQDIGNYLLLQLHPTEFVRILNDPSCGRRGDVCLTEVIPEDPGGRAHIEDQGSSEA